MEKLYRAHFGRLLALDERIRAGKRPNCSSFAREWEVSAKTVQRDIEFLRDVRGAPIEYDPIQRGYVYSDPSWRLQPLELGEAELLQLAVAERMAAQYRGTPIAATLSALFDKLRAALPGRVRIDPIDVQQRISFHGHPVREVPKETWRTVARAIRDRRRLRIDYRRYGADAARVHRVEPVHLASLDGEWMLVARIVGREELTLFALSRIARARAERAAAAAIDFDPGAFFANRFGRFVGTPGAASEIVVRFSRDAAPGVLERTWHPRQSVARRSDGSVELRFPAPSLYEIQRWVLQWGGDAEVIAPAELRRAVARESRRLVARYRGTR
jgi:predicted DNA-binding transcriptional regulator YafY